MSDTTSMREGDAVQVAGMHVSYDPQTFRVVFDTDPSGDQPGHQKFLEKSDVSILIRYLNRVHGVM